MPEAYQKKALETLKDRYEAKEEAAKKAEEAAKKTAATVRAGRMPALGRLHLGSAVRVLCIWGILITYWGGHVINGILDVESDIWLNFLAILGGSAWS